MKLIFYEILKKTSFCTTFFCKIHESKIPRKSVPSGPSCSMQSAGRTGDEIDSGFPADLQKCQTRKNHTSTETSSCLVKVRSEMSTSLYDGL